MSNKKYTSSELREIAKYHKLVCYCILVSVLSILFLTPFAVQFGNSSLISFMGLPISAFELFCLYKLARALKFSIVLIIFLGLCSFMPFLGLIILLFMNSQAIKPLKEAGIKVGMLGADINSIDIS